MLEKWRRARDSNPQGPRGPVDFKSTALPVEASPPCPEERLLTIHHVLAWAANTRLGLVTGSFGSTLRDEALNCRLKMAGRKVRIALHHTQRLPSAKLLHGPEIDTLLDPANRYKPDPGRLGRPQ